MRLSAWPRRAVTSRSLELGRALPAGPGEYPAVKQALDHRRTQHKAL